MLLPGRVSPFLAEIWDRVFRPGKDAMVNSEHAVVRPARFTLPAWVIHFESEWVLLTILALCLYATRLTDLSVRGEESRRGRIAWEMVQSGDWLVPRVQGLPRLSRPPLQYWAIACVGLMRGEVDALAVRIPCVVATVLTVLL